MIRADWNLETHVADIAPVERALIGACLYPKVPMPPLLEEEFAIEKHRRIWAAMQRLAVEDEGIELVTVTHELAKVGELEEAGGSAHLALCFEEAHIATYVQPMARQIREACRERRLVQLGKELAAKGFDETEIERRLAEIPGALTGALYDPAHDWNAIVSGWKTGRIRTTFSGLDAITGGFGRGDFVIVGGRTSHGKTAWLVALVLRLINQGIDVEYVTLEESSAAITRRMVGNRAGLSIRRLKDGDVNDFEFEWAQQAVRWLQEQPLTVTGMDQVRTLEESAVVGTVGASKAPVVIIDHLQQVTTPGKESRVYGLERVLKRLQAVALRDGKVVILAAQLNRETETRQGAPRLSDLRDCGAIEQAGRQILLLYWPCKHDRERSQEEYELYVAKQSDGGTGLVPLRFEARTGRFHDVDGALGR